MAGIVGHCIFRLMPRCPRMTPEGPQQISEVSRFFTMGDTCCQLDKHVSQDIDCYNCTRQRQPWNPANLPIATDQPGSIISDFLALHLRHHHVREVHYLCRCRTLGMRPSRR